MRLYSGQTRSWAWARQLLDADIGECCVRGELPPRRIPWFYDNGAYRDFVEGQPFLEHQWRYEIGQIVTWMESGIPEWIMDGKLDGIILPPPDFIVLPDLVAQGLHSLKFTEAWLLPHYDYRANPRDDHPQNEFDNAGFPQCGYPVGVPLYVAVQNGMEMSHVLSLCCRYPAIGGIFGGGTMDWKIATAADWVKFAHALHMKCHIGRAISLKRRAWAERIGADSVDGNAPNWSTEGLARLTRARPQMELLK